MSDYRSSYTGDEIDGAIGYAKSLKDDLPGGVSDIVPRIGENGNWYTGDTDTGKPSRGLTGPVGPTGADGAPFAYEDFTSEQKMDLMIVAGAAGSIVSSAEGSLIRIKDSDDRKIYSFDVCGKSVQDGTPSPTNIVAIQYVPEGTSITLSDGGIQTQTVTTPCDLYEGDTWNVVTGEVSRKTYVAVLDGSENWRKRSEYSGNRFSTNLPEMYSTEKPFLSTIGKTKDTRYVDGYIPGVATVANLIKYGVSLYSIEDDTGCYITLESISTVSDLKSFLATNPITLVYTLAEPITEQYDSHPELRTYKPVTVVTNDADAEMQLKYVADTKAYIDNKFNELTTAIVALGTV